MKALLFHPSRGIRQAEAATRLGRSHGLRPAP